MIQLSKSCINHGSRLGQSFNGDMVPSIRVLAGRFTRQYNPIGDFVDLEPPRVGALASPLASAPALERLDSCKPLVLIWLADRPHVVEIEKQLLADGTSAKTVTELTRSTSHDSMGIALCMPGTLVMALLQSLIM